MKTYSIEGLLTMYLLKRTLTFICTHFSFAVDSEIDGRFQLNTTATNKSMMPLTDKQWKPMDKLKDILKKTDQVEKLMFFPLHGDKPVK